MIVLLLRMMHIIITTISIVIMIYDTQVDSSEIEELAEELNACRVGHSGGKVEYYKVDFEEVLPLVSKRKIYLANGYGYLPDTDLHTFILNKYKMYLKEQLAVSIICKH